MVDIDAALHEQTKLCRSDPLWVFATEPAKRLRMLEDENAKLKKLLAKVTRPSETAQEIIRARRKEKDG